MRFFLPRHDDAWPAGHHVGWVCLTLPALLYPACQAWDVRCGHHVFPATQDEQWLICTRCRSLGAPRTVDGVAGVERGGRGARVTGALGGGAAEGSRALMPSALPPPLPFVIVPPLCLPSTPVRAPPSPRGTLGGVAGRGDRGDWVGGRGGWVSGGGVGGSSPHPQGGLG